MAAGFDVVRDEDGLNLQNWPDHHRSRIPHLPLLTGHLCPSSSARPIFNLLRRVTRPWCIAFGPTVREVDADGDSQHAVTSPSCLRLPGSD